MYRELKPDPIIATVRQLSRRIEERFPGSGLSRVAQEVLDVTRATRATIRAIERPNYWLRGGVWLLAAILVIAPLAVLVTLRRSGGDTEHLAGFLQAMEAGINDLLLIGAAVAFLVTIEVRIKRRRALSALHELRSLAHVIDMHQLSKDPERILLPGLDTESSPKRTMSAFELSRYFDYCSELLSILSKVAALYAQSFDDAVALAAVDEVETLTAGLSRKIWQKLMILNSIADRLAAPQEPTSPLLEA